MQVRSVCRGAQGGEAVSVGGFDDETGCGHGGEALIESGGTDATRCAQFGEWPWFAALGESRGDALIDGDRLDAAFGLRIGLDRLEGKSVITLGEFERNRAVRRRRDARWSGRCDRAIAAKVQVRVAPGVELRGSAQGLPRADGAGTFPRMVHKRTERACRR